jgi:hypothetical protein
MTMKSVLQTMSFNEWFKLAEQDPSAFESIRRTLIDELIESAPTEQQQRLRCLQWRIDQERRRSSSPLGACIRMSNMMWERVTGKNGLLENVGRLRGIEHSQDEDDPSPDSAKVIPLYPKG